MTTETKERKADSAASSLAIRARPSAPDILIHLHIPKTGGMSLNSMIKHAFRNDEVFDSTARGGETYSGLGLATYESCQERLLALGPDGLNRIRYIAGHVPMGVHRILGRPAKYFTVIRHPVDRVISLFYFRQQLNDAYVKNGKRITLEEYVEDGYDILLQDFQVRVVSGCRDLDAKAPSPGEQISAPAVEDRHLEEAKRNIDQHFLTTAPLETMTELALLVRRIYGWPMRRLQTEYKNPTKGRPRLMEISPRLIKMIEDCNRHDMELYEWVKKRFAEQRQLFEPGLSRDRRIFGTVNRMLNTVGDALPLPWSMRKRIAEILFYAR